MKRIILILLYFIFFSPVASAWTINADFEGGKIGALAEGARAFSTSRDNTFFSDTYSRNGSLSAKASINKGETAGMGGTFFPNVEPSQGDEMWWSCSVFFPTGFNFSVGGSGLKLMRVQVKSSSNTSQGYHNILLKQNGLSINSALSSSTFTANNPVRSGLGGSIATNKWHTFETYFKFSTTQGIWRIWKDGKLIFEDEKTFTLINSSDKATRGLVFTYWNDGAPASQSAYIDDCIMTSDTPPKYDANGNSFIGVGAASGVAPPKPPVILE
jgi:hypothetical protein